MIDQTEHTASVAAIASSAALPLEHTLDGRRPLLLDHRGLVLQIVVGHVDIFAVDVKDAKRGRRHYLFRVESGDIVPDLPVRADLSANGLSFIAVGSEATRVSILRRTDLASVNGAIRWIQLLARLIAGSAPQWQIAELPDRDAELAEGERRRGPMRDLLWVTVDRGVVRLMGVGTPYAVGDHPLPLTSGLWVEAGEGGSAVAIAGEAPTSDQIWSSIDHFHLVFVACAQDILLRETRRDSERLAGRIQRSASQAVESFDRLAGIVVTRFDPAAVDVSDSNRLAAACQIV